MKSAQRLKTTLGQEAYESRSFGSGRATAR